MYILGISAFYHDSAACLIKDGEIIAAVKKKDFQEKHDSNFPYFASRYCLQEAGINSNDITNVVFYEKPFLKFERLIETYLAFAPKGFTSFARAMPIWIKDKLFQKSFLIKKLNETLGNKVNWEKDYYFQNIIYHMQQAHSILLHLKERLY